MEETNNGWIILALIVWGTLMRFSPGVALYPMYLAWIAIEALIWSPLAYLFGLLTKPLRMLAKKVFARKPKAHPAESESKAPLSEKGVDWNNTIRGRNLAKRGINHQARVNKFQKEENKKLERIRQERAKEKAERTQLAAQRKNERRRKRKERERVAAAEKARRGMPAWARQVLADEEARRESNPESRTESDSGPVLASILAAGAAGAAGAAWASDDWSETHAGVEDTGASFSNDDGDNWISSSDSDSYLDSDSAFDSDSTLDTSCTMVNPSTGYLMECGSGIDSGGYMLGEDPSSFFDDMSSSFDDDTFSSPFDDSFSSFDD